MNEVVIIRKNVRRATLRVKSSSEVVFTAPINMSHDLILQFIQDKQPWIAKNLKRFALLEEAKIISYNTGDSIQYLGCDYVLKVIEAKSECIECKDDQIILFILAKNNCFEYRKLILEKWYQAQAKQLFVELIDKYKILLNKQVNHLTIRQMKTRWGSCNPTKGYINLNVELIKYPLEAIEYVVLHELAHLEHRGHGEVFYSYIATFMPDWKIRDKLLKHKRFVE